MPEVGIKASIDFNSLTVNAGSCISTVVTLAAFTAYWFPIPATLIAIGSHASFAPKISIGLRSDLNTFLTFPPNWFPIPATLIAIGTHASFAPKIPIGLRSELSVFFTFTRSLLQILFGDTYQQNFNELVIIIDSLPINDKSKAQYLLAGILFNALEAFVNNSEIKVSLWDVKTIQESGVPTRYAAITVEVYEQDNG